MPSIFWLIPIYFVHWFCDFIMQDQHTRENKWNNNSTLAYHIFCYASIPVFGFIAILCLGFGQFMSVKLIGLIWLFLGINIFSHWLIDYITSRESHKHFAVNDYWTGFNVVGFDQMLHYLILTISFVVIF